MSLTGQLVLGQTPAPALIEGDCLHCQQPLGVELIMGAIDADGALVGHVHRAVCSLLHPESFSGRTHTLVEVA